MKKVFHYVKQISAWFKENLPAVCEDGEPITPGLSLLFREIFI